MPPGRKFWKAFVRGHCQRFDARRIGRPPGDVDFGRGNRRGHAAMEITFEESDRLLPRRVIAECRVDVAVDQPRYGRRAVRVDHYVGVGHFAGRSGANADDSAGFGRRSYRQRGTDFASRR